jgi:steroid delta-isomerase-like uncharacterized protein
MRLHRRHSREEGSDGAAARAGDEPFPGYDSAHERELVDGLYRHTQEELAAIEAYELAHQRRTRVLNKLRYLRQHQPLPDYDSMSPDEIAAELERADLETIKDVRAYERKFANRAVVLEAVEAARRRRTAEHPHAPLPGFQGATYGGSPDRPHPQDPAANKAIVARFYAEAINERDLGAVDRLLSDDFTHDGERRGREGQRAAVKAFLDAFPDLRNEIEILIAEGDVVAAHQRWRGTHGGTFAGVEPTGRQVEFTSTAILRLEDGLIAEAWDEVDLAGLLEQLSAGSVD